MKKKVLLSSILTIALCLSIIAGSTYALFTSKSEVNIAVTAGKVDVTAGIAITKLWSVQADDTAGNIEDEWGGKYSYSYTDDVADVDGYYDFLNGGKAIIEEIENVPTLTITKMTPGDKIDLAISGDNTSNVAIQYRYIIECVGGYDLMHGLVVYVPDEANGYVSLDTYTSKWFPLAAETDMSKAITLELPVTAGNEYQEKSVDIKITVEAVQGNANTNSEATSVATFITKAATAEEAAAALRDADTDYVLFTEDNMKVSFETATAISNKTIDLGGNNVELVLANTTLENVVITGVESDDDATPAISLSGATGDVTITDSYIYDHSSQPYGGVAGGNENLDVTFINCTLEGARPVYNSGNAKSITMIDCTIKNTSSWAVLINTAVAGDVVVDGCTFENCVGLFKVTRPVGGNFTFTNNTIVDCTTKNNFYIDAKVTGDIIVAGNTMIQAGNVTDPDMTAADMLALVQYVPAP